MASMSDFYVETGPLRPLVSAATQSSKRSSALARLAISVLLIIGSGARAGDAVLECAA
jgi:hypothetical protein